MTRRGTLRIYLGAAPGVGKTFAMLNEGWRRRQRGTDVVVGFVEAHGREATAAQVRDLEVVPRRRVNYRDTDFEEMDVDAILARRPDVALVDELAHTNVPGSRNAKRWQDVHQLLDAGIDVVSTVNIQHLESLNDVVERITGITQRETIPDQIVRAAEQVELVDMTAEALRRRMAHGHIYAADKVDAALGNYFRVGNLSALRELALLWVADRVDESLEDYRRRHGIGNPWETKERVVVALTGPRAARTSSGGRHGSRNGPTVSSSACTSRPTTAWPTVIRPATISLATVRPARPRSCSRVAAGCSRSWEANTTTSPGPTSPTRSWSSPGARTPPSSSWGRAGAPACRSWPGGRSSTRCSGAPGRSTST